MVGGLVGHQVGPLKPRGDGVRSFRHEISLLAEVPCEVGGVWSRQGFERLEIVAGFGTPPDRQPFLMNPQTEEVQLVEVAAMPMDSRMAL